MSEFTKLSKAISVLSDTIAEYAKKVQEVSSITESSNLLAEITKKRDHFKSLLVPATKQFISKIDYIDPVSGLARYGPEMRAKIMKLSLLTDELEPQFEHVLLIAKDRNNELILLEPKEIAYNDASEPAVESPADVGQSELERAAAAANLERLHQEAEAVRLKKKKRIDLKQMVVRELQQRLSSWKETERLTLLSALGYLLIPENSKEKVITVCSTLSELLNRITLKPDDKKLRTVKLSNPIFYEKVTSVSGSEKVLVAIGFDIRLEGRIQEDGSIPESSTEKYYPFEEWVQDVINLGKEDVTQDCNQFVSSLFIPNESSSPLSNVTRIANVFGYDVICSLNEPLVDSSSLDGFQVWIDWFDAIKANSDTIATFKATL